MRHPLSIRTRPARPLLRGRAAIVLAVVLAASLAGGLSACDSNTAPADAPEGHTVIKDGVAHAPGLNSPQANCATCHGADLRGGEAGEPSCFRCHGQKW